jgi:hypothetical protein
MPAYQANYDLHQPGRNYQPLWDRLAQWGAFRVLESCWIVPEAAGAEALRDDLRQYMDSNDSLLVSRVTGEMAWANLRDTSPRRLQGLFGVAA